MTFQILFTRCRQRKTVNRKKHFELKLNVNIAKSKNLLRILRRSSSEKLTNFFHVSGFVSVPRGHRLRLRRSIRRANHRRLRRRLPPDRLCRVQQKDPRESDHHHQSQEA